MPASNIINLFTNWSSYEPSACHAVLFSWPRTYIYMSFECADIGHAKTFLRPRHTFQLSRFERETPALNGRLPF